MVVRELITRLGFQLNNAQVQNAERATSRLKQQADQAAQSFRNIITAVASFQMVRSIVHVADSMQSLRARIDQLPQTIMPASEAFDVVAEHASDARASIEAYGTLYNRIGNAAKDYISTQEDLLKVTDTISKALVVGGATAQEASSVMTQFSQALGAGTLQGEEFRAMAEAAPQYMDQLAEALGHPRGELKKLASEGKITTKQVIEATKNMADYFDMRFKQMPMTVGQAMTIVGNRFSRMIDRMNRESNFVTKTANIILDVFEKIEKGVDFVIEKFDGWSNAIRYVGIALGILVASKAFVLLASIGAIAAVKFALIAAAVLLIAALIEDFVVWLQGGDSLIGDMLEKFGQWATAISTAIDDGLAYAENAVLETIKGWSDALYRMFVETIPKAIRDAWNAVTSLPGNIIDSIKNGASSLTGGGAAFGVTPSSVASATGNRTVVSNNTNNVSIQVPAGTGPEQVEFVKNGTQKYMDSLNKPMTTRDAMAYGG